MIELVQNLFTIIGVIFVFSYGMIQLHKLFDLALKSLLNMILGAGYVTRFFMKFDEYEAREKKVMQYKEELEKEWRKKK